MTFESCPVLWVCFRPVPACLAVDLVATEFTSVVFRILHYRNSLCIRVVQNSENHRNESGGGGLSERQGACCFNSFNPTRRGGTECSASSSSRVKRKLSRTRGLNLQAGPGAVPVRQSYYFVFLELSDFCDLFLAFCFAVTCGLASGCSARIALSCVMVSG